MDIFAQLLRDIFSREGFIAVIAVCLIIILALVVAVLFMLVKRKDKKDDTVNTQADVIAALIIQIQAIATTNQTATESMRVVSENLKVVAQFLSEHDARALEIRKALDSAVGEMHKSEQKRSDQIEGLPGKVVEAMQPELDKLPIIIKEALTPAIETLKADIGKIIQTLDEQLEKRLAKVSDEIPAKTNALVKSELAAFREVMDQRLSQFGMAAQAVAENEVKTINSHEENKPDGTVE